jgi:hypothetical protein
LWTGDLIAGMHRLEVAVPGSPPAYADITVVANQASEVQIALAPGAGPSPAPVPAEFPPPAAAPPPPPRTYYAMAGVAGMSETLTFGPAMDEKADDTKRGLSGGALVIKFGRHVTRAVDGELNGEIGSITPRSYQSPNDLTQAAKVTMTTWAIAPGVRWHTQGALRFLLGAQLGIEGQSVSASFGTGSVPDGTVTRKASWVSAMALAELGLQLKLGSRAFAEMTVFANVHGVGTARDDAGDRFFLDSPATREGVRLLIGLEF